MPWTEGWSSSRKSTPPLNWCWWVIPVGLPWELRVPTTLVKLRPDDALPSWVKQPDGTWVESAP